MGAVSILDFKARNKKLPDSGRQELFDLYIQKHDRINNWDLVDRAAPFVVGQYLIDKPRDILYTLAKSQNMWERRTAITATLFFIRYGSKADVKDVLALAKILLDDTEELVCKSVGIALKYVAIADKRALLGFLDEHASNMSGATLTYAIEKLDAAEREKYRKTGAGK